MLEAEQLLLFRMGRCQCGIAGPTSTSTTSRTGSLPRPLASCLALASGAAQGRRWEGASRITLRHEPADGVAATRNSSDLIGSLQAEVLGLAGRGAEHGVALPLRGEAGR